MMMGSGTTVGLPPWATLVYKLTPWATLVYKLTATNEVSVCLAFVQPNLVSQMY
jgi:hypothetical protein